MNGNPLHFVAQEYPITTCPNDTRVITAHVPVQLAERVDQLAAHVGRSKGWIVRQALCARIDQEEERSSLTRAALADVDAGCVIDHQTVQAWANSVSSDTPLPVPVPR
ncbi:ribbon-helix-helix protein, CopG family [Pseudomonas sp. JM0905a]|uniref:CopG family ribbon-helix-helix protein n=1 Tax=Pseudomonas sp. JM0905a TaxID=2772484 RepID=UPI0016834A85|nr:ribbon-helix-helix domain-containing protein [Pseudomonas sp. JM0905a]MBD2840597.1 ribbon-helix-helix protein, CopG family [Pseudomonas sp. JM0905a]